MVGIVRMLSSPSPGRDWIEPVRLLKRPFRPLLKLTSISVIIHGTACSRDICPEGC